MSMSKPALWAVAVCALNACATPNSQLPDMSNAEVAAEQLRQREFVAHRLLEQRHRLNAVAFKINVANADMCPERRAATIGVDAVDLDDADAAVRRAVERWSGERKFASDAVVVASVAPGSPADAAGLRHGDVILNPRPPEKDAASVGHPGWAPSRVSADRDGKPMTFTLTPQAACGYELALVRDANVNAYADGGGVFLTQGMMNFARDDDELGLVYGHELAHNVMGHRDAKTQNAVAGAVAGAAVDILFAIGGVNTGGGFTEIGGEAGAGAYSVDFEKEADYVGLYLAYRGGYGSVAPGDFWRRMAAEEDPVMISVAGSHPTSPERFVLLDRTLNEILHKQSRGMALRPNAQPWDSGIETADTAPRTSMRQE